MVARTGLLRRHRVRGLRNHLVHVGRYDGDHRHQVLELVDFGLLDIEHRRLPMPGAERAGDAASTGYGLQWA